MTCGACVKTRGELVLLRAEILSLFGWKLDQSRGIALGLVRAVNDLRAQLAAETARREAAEKRADELGRERVRLYGRLVREMG